MKWASTSSWSAPAHLGDAPAWGPLLRACGFAEVITAGVRVDYVPISTGFESATIYWYDDGVLHKGLGARGTASLKLSVGEKPVISCKFVCLYGGIAVAAAPTADLEEWQVPEIVLDANSGNLIWGATHAIGHRAGAGRRRVLSEPGPDH